MVARVITAMGGRSAHVVHGRSALSLVTGVGAATLVLLAAAHSSASPPLGEDVSGVGASTLTMGAAAAGTVIAPVSGLGSAVLTIGNEGHGLAFGSVTGTGAATLDLIAAGEGSANGVSGAGASTLTLLAAGSGTYLPLVTGAGSTALTLTAAASGTFLTPVVGVGSAALTLIAAGTGTGTTSAPAAVSAPVTGTDLTAVWNLQLAGATGHRNTFTNGTWGARSLAGGGQPTGDAYLDSLGFVVSNPQLAIFLDIGAATVTVSNYDFSGLPVGVNIGGSTGTINFVDCKFAGTAPAGSLMYPTNINTTLSPYDGGSVTVNCTYCTFSSSQFFQGAGFLNFSHCKFTGQLNQLGGSTFHGTATANVTFDWCYIPGGGIAPTVNINNHVELFQMIRSGQLVVINSLINLSEGQVNAPPWLSAWTGLWSGPDYQRFTNCIMVGLVAVNANPANPNTMKAAVSYGTGADVVVANCVMEPGWAGYTVNATPGPAYASINGGGNRTFANVALTAGDFG